MDKEDIDKVLKCVKDFREDENLFKIMCDDSGSFISDFGYVGYYNELITVLKRMKKLTKKISAHAKK